MFINFEFPYRWRTAAILKIDISPYFSEKSYDFHEILYTTADFELDERHVIKNEKVALDRLRVRKNIFLVFLNSFFFILHGVKSAMTFFHRRCILSSSQLQEAQLLQRGRASLHVVKKLLIHSTPFEIILLSRVCVSSCQHFIVTRSTICA